VKMNKYQIIANPVKVKLQLQMHRTR
jgi:hypothetical protein